MLFKKKKDENRNFPVFVCIPPYLESQIEIGELLTAGAVLAVNVVKDFKETVRNIVGGAMGHYENLVEDSIDRAVGRLIEKAKEKGYEGIVGFRIAHPSLVDGGAEVVVYGNGFKFKKEED
jgi:uncharacterized protein YbjQ (UPF0145 family)